MLTKDQMTYMTAPVDMTTGRPMGDHARHFNTMHEAIEWANSARGAYMIYKVTPLAEKRMSYEFHTVNAKDPESYGKSRDELIEQAMNDYLREIEAKPIDPGKVIEAGRKLDDLMKE